MSCIKLYISPVILNIYYMFLNTYISYTIMILKTLAVLFISVLNVNLVQSVSTTEVHIFNSFQRLLIDITRTNNYENVVPDSSVSTYDFVIVGSGPGGSVLANRLSSNSNWKILLLEAGMEASLLTEVPIFASQLQYTGLDWNYTTEKQENVCFGCQEQRMHFPKGKALGGSTEINFMVQVRGNRIDYDRWAAMGNDGWSYDDVLPYFLKIEDANLQVFDEGYHNKGGPVPVSDILHRSKIADDLVQAAQEAGHSYVDYNGKEQMGVSYVQGAVGNGKRWSAEKAYLRPVKNRPNLTIIKGAMVTKILIRNETKTAYGVLFDKGGKSYQALASKEVILAAGAFASPQLLMLSGVGPKDHLEELKIPVVKDLPVGKKMIDHITFSGLLFHVNESVVHTFSDILNPINYLEFYLYGKGPLTTIGLTEVLVYLKTNVSQETEAYPDIELLIYGGNIAVDHGLAIRRALNINEKIYNDYFKYIEDQTFYQVYPMLTHPKSSGYMKLTSKSVYDTPQFYPNYYSDLENQDMKTIIASIREVQKINASPALQKYNSTIFSLPVPGCGHLTFDTDVYWECALRHLTTTVYHQMATCKMGPKSDKESVVDNELKVHGINGLRVVDTSVIPLPLTAHLTLPAYMIGEKAADIVKNHWNGK